MTSVVRALQALQGSTGSVGAGFAEKTIADWSNRHRSCTASFIKTRKYSGIDVGEGEDIYFCLLKLKVKLNSSVEAEVSRPPQPARRGYISHY